VAAVTGGMDQPDIDLASPGPLVVPSVQLKHQHSMQQ
jgi:hypothetical protein